MRRGRPATGAARARSVELRLSRDRMMRKRRAVVRLEALAITSLLPVAAYQAGVIERLPGRGRLDGSRVAASPQAYWLLAAPDAALGLASYAGTLSLATAGGRARWRRRPWLPLTLYLKLVLDALIGGALLREEWATQRRICIPCLIPTISTALALVAAAPEGRAALREARRGRGSQR